MIVGRFMDGIVEDMIAMQEREYEIINTIRPLLYAALNTSRMDFASAKKLVGRRYDAIYGSRVVITVCNRLRDEFNDCEGSLSRLSESDNERYEFEAERLGEFLDALDRVKERYEFLESRGFTRREIERDLMTDTRSPSPHLLAEILSILR